MSPRPCFPNLTSLDIDVRDDPLATATIYGTCSRFLKWLLRGPPMLHTLNLVYELEDLEAVNQVFQHIRGEIRILRLTPTRMRGRPSESNQSHYQSCF